VVEGLEDGLGRFFTNALWRDLARQDGFFRRRCWLLFFASSQTNKQAREEGYSL